ncbi:MAG: DUF2508 family protein [Clostridium sp.]|uniref:DUF2508 domain-containing protein n=1 Tax=Clostridium paraputrificum TaxID=29363 RepID=A0A6N3ECG4_9CLOT|nr:DUF2508 family protein [Clostridium sp.]MBS5927603.1 DUF2508 family protein [Clostridium sp.]MBS5986592.1 DUF2508 family protein [Clostridium sp.]
MNKKNIIQYITGIKESENEGLDIIDAIEDAKAELEAARSIFDNVQDSKLIELAIYAEEVALKRYEYLLSLAKERDIRVSNEYILDRCIRMAE